MQIEVEIGFSFKLELEEGFRTVLNDGDRLTILPPVGGG